MFLTSYCKLFFYLNPTLQYFITNKYSLDFETEENLNAKSEEKSADDVIPATELEDTSLSTCHKKISDIASSEISLQQTEQNDVSSCVIEEPKIPSPASNVEIVISDTGLQSFEPGNLICFNIQIICLI